MLHVNEYTQILDTARNYFDSASRGKSVLAINHMEKFFDEANKEVIIEQANRPQIIDIHGKILKRTKGVKEKFNPSIARMALQQGDNDIRMGQALAYMAGDIAAKDYKQLYANRMVANLSMRQDPRFLALNERLKEMYPKTFKRRLAIIPCLADGVQVVLQNQNNGIISATEQAFGEDLGLAEVKAGKGKKKFIHLLRRIFTKPYLRK